MSADRVKFVPMSCYGSKPAEFLAINPRGGIPVATIDGRTMTESKVILAAIESAFPDQHPLYPGMLDTSANVTYDRGFNASLNQQLNI